MTKKILNILCFRYFTWLYSPQLQFWLYIDEPRFVDLEQRPITPNIVPKYMVNVFHLRCYPPKNCFVWYAPFQGIFYSDRSKREIDNYWMETHLNPRQLKSSFVFTPRKELRRQMKESSFVNSSTCFLQPCRSYPGPGLSWLLHKMTVAKLFWSGQPVIYHRLIIFSPNWPSSYDYNTRNYKEEVLCK